MTGVARPRSFTLAELRELPWEERVLVMECAGNGNHVVRLLWLIGNVGMTYGSRLPLSLLRSMNAEMSVTAARIR